jgi:hypothetical protein
MAQKKTCVIIESPYRAHTSEAVYTNTTYLNECIRDSLDRGEAPFASHMMYTTTLNDCHAGERELGISCGYAWWPNAELIAFYVDHGWSEGMLAARDRATALGKRIAIRKSRR